LVLNNLAHEVKARQAETFYPGLRGRLMDVPKLKLKVEWKTKKDALILGIFLRIN
jgi:hypothetical protein